MICWSLCAFIWFQNIEKMLLQMTSGFLQLESTLPTFIKKDISQNYSKILFYLNSAQVAKTHLSFATALLWN
jgi:hypothetical protein